MRILAVIPARAGSKGIPNKNIRIINGHPLIYYSIKNALDSEWITDVIVSTDSPEVKIIAEQMGVKVKWRDELLCGDDVTLDAVIADAIPDDTYWDYVVTMQATSPTLSVLTLDTAIKYAIDKNLDTVISAINAPHLSWGEKDGKKVPNYVERLNRQYLPPCYMETGAFMVSKASIITSKTRIGENVEIGPFVFIDKNVVIGDNNTIMPNANILYGSRIGNGNTIFPGAVIGAIPQDLKFRGEETTAEIGDNNTIRENVTINRGTAAKGKTIVGSNNLLMEGVHVAHDAIIGSGCIIGNATKMAGEIIIDDNAIISGAVLMHQFCRVGGYVMVQGGSRFSKDIPPYIIAGREPIAYAGINIVGLRRRGFSNELIENIHNTYRIIYQNGMNVTDALEQVRKEIPMSKEIEYIISFIENSQRGIIR